VATQLEPTTEKRRYEVKVYLVVQRVSFPTPTLKVVDVVLNRALAVEIADTLPNAEVRRHVAWRHSGQLDKAPRATVSISST
jgi:hypothetical protein